MIKKFALLLFLLSFLSCGLQIYQTNQDVAELCAQGSIQNDFEIRYVYGGSPFIEFNFAEIAHPLKATFRDRNF